VILWPAVYLITIGCLAAGLYATSLPGWDIGLALLSYAGCSVIAGFWVYSFTTVAGRSRGRMRNRTLARWLGIPVFGYLSLALVFLNVPGTVRFDLSRQALEAAALQTEGSRAQSGWIGLMPVDEIRRDSDGTTIFLIQDGGFGSCGLAFNPYRTPTDDAAGLSGRVADDWWTWCEPYMD
jgi:hypothetical protein